MKIHVNVSLRVFVFSLLIVTSGFVGTIWFVASSLDTTWSAYLVQDRFINGRDNVFSTDGSFSEIFSRNISVIAFLFSGVATFGATTIVAILLISMGIGAVGTLVIQSQGLALTFQQILPYAPFELLGLVISGIAGIYPALNLFSQRKNSTEFSLIKRYANSLNFSFFALLVAFLFITLGAVIESLVISATLRPTLLGMYGHVI